MRLLPSLLCIGLASVSFSQSNVLQGHRLTTPPVIDGEIGDDWEGVPSVEGLVNRRDAVPKPHDAKFWLAYDENFIYFAARLIEEDPKSVRASEFRSNVSLNADDFVALVIDPFGRTDGYNVFMINPRGATNLEIAGGRAAKREWLGEFHAKGRITETGWEVEARIPWGIMRLPTPGSRELSFNIFHYDPRQQREYIWSYSANNTENFGRWVGVEVPASGNRRSIKALPYLYGGWDERDGGIANAGLDLKTSLSDQIDAVASINPDFRNIENQILSLDFSYFERLAAESRPFFLEGQEFFQTSRDSPLFASQRIRSFDAGFKSFGRISDETEFAVLDTIDFNNQNVAVANVRHRPNPDTTFTAAYAGLETPGLSNQGTYLSANRSLGSWFLFGQHMTTRDTALGYGHRYNTGFGYNFKGINSIVEYVEVSPEFLPRVGFAPQRNYRGFFSNFGYDKIFERGAIMEAGFNVNAFDYRRFDGSQYRSGGFTSTSVTMRDGLDMDLVAQYENFQGSHDHVYGISIEKPRGNPYRRWQMDYFQGRISGQSYRNISAGVFYRPLSPLQLSLRVQNLQHFENSTQTILSMNYDLTADTSVAGRAVQRDHDINFYLAYRRAGNRGVEYYLILGDPNARTFRASLVLKVVVPLELRF